MAIDEVLGPRKTMFVLVIVVGCFAVLWPRILSPLILGHSSDHLKPNKFDREAGCCEVIFSTEVAVLQLVDEVCGPAQSAVACRRAVNDTCGVDIAAFVTRRENVGKTAKMLAEAMRNSNSSCLRRNFGVPVYSLGAHLAVDSNYQQDILKQERPPIRIGQHPALLERGRAIPPGPPPASRPVVLPPHVRVRSPLSVYYELDIQPPPIPGMRPPLGSPGGPVPAPKSSMGFVMPIYTICIIVFFVYTLSKILFKRSATPYEPVAPDPQFRRRVFRDDSRSSPDKLVVSAISGLVAEVSQQMEAGRAHPQQRQEVLDNARPYTNGTIIHSGPVQIVASEYKEKTSGLQEKKEATPVIKEVDEPIETAPDVNESIKVQTQELIEKETPQILKESTPDLDILAVDTNKEIEPASENIEQMKNDLIDTETKENLEDKVETIVEELKNAAEDKNAELDAPILHQEELVNNQEDNLDLIKLSEGIGLVKDDETKLVEFLDEERKDGEQENVSTEDLLEEAIKDLSEEVLDDKENQSVKVMGMETTAHAADGGSYKADPPKAPVTPHSKTHEAEEVQSIFLETEIPQQSRVLVADFAEQRPRPETRTHSPLVVSGKITLSLIQDAPRDTPDRDLESTVDEFTTASAFTQPAAEKEDDLEASDEEIEIEEEIEVEEIEEEEVEEEDLDGEVKTDAERK